MPNERIVRAAALAAWLLGFVWNAVLVLGCAYLVFWRGESGWWFLLTFTLLAH